MPAVTKNLLLLSILALTPWADRLAAQEEPKPAATRPECSETLEICVEQKRQEWKTRGTLGVKVHAPHSETTGERSHGQESHGPGHQAGLWYVELVAPGGAAEAAGLQRGDHLIEWDGRPMPPSATVFDTWTAAIRRGQRITVKIARAGELKTVTLTAKAAEPWVMEAWLMSYVQRNYSESEYLAYRQGVMRRAEQQ